MEIDRHTNSGRRESLTPRNIVFRGRRETERER